MICLVDGDIVAYRCAATANDDPVDVALYRVDKLMREIIEASASDQYQVWISGNNNYRKVINESYKANRKDMVPPVWRQECLEFLVTEHGAKLAPFGEADDMLGINQTSDTIIASIDKDLLMIPGKHFNWTKQQFGDYTEVGVDEGNKHFWKQMLIGDRSDNIFGVQGLGPVKAGKLIDPCETDQECMEVVLSKYDDQERFLLNANCLWIMRHKESIWYQDLDLILPSELQQEQEALSKSITSVREST
jgi:5'-3' exonuclease